MLPILNPDYRDHANAFIKGIIKKEIPMPLNRHKKRHPSGLFITCLLRNFLFKYL